MDLNFNYTDGKENLYNFKNEEEYFRSTDYLLKAKIKIASQYLQMSLFEKEEIFTELAIKCPEIEINCYLNKRYNYSIIFDKICSYYFNKDTKSLLFGNSTQYHQLNSTDNVLDYMNNQILDDSQDNSHL